MDLQVALQMLAVLVLPHPLQELLLLVLAVVAVVSVISPQPVVQVVLVAVVEVAAALVRKPLPA